MQLRRGTPSGNIGCMMNLADEPMFDCGVKSFMESEQFGIGELGTPRWMMEILGGYPREQTDPPLYDDSVWPPGGESAEVVYYGEVVNHGLTFDDIDLIELNEAFAAQVLAVLDAWRISEGDPRLNPVGSGISQR